jgi:hypothetical protein
MATGENSGTWGNVTNANLGDAIEQALVETATVTFASNNVTLTLSDSNSRQNARALRLNLTGTTAGARDLIVPAIQKPYLVNNGTADTITVKVSGQTGVAVPAGASMLLYNNGTDVGVAFNRVGDVTGNVTGNLTGTASNATVLQTARTIAIQDGVTGTATSFNGSANISIPVTGINASVINTGTINNARTTASSSNGASTIVARDASGNFTANVITANGSAITSINASNISSGTVATARLGSGTANSSTFLRGDQTYATPSGGMQVDTNTTTNATDFALGQYLLSHYNAGVNSANVNKVIEVRLPTTDSNTLWTIPVGVANFNVNATFRVVSGTWRSRGATTVTGGQFSGADGSIYGSTSFLICQRTA